MPLSVSKYAAVTTLISKIALGDAKASDELQAELKSGLDCASHVNGRSIAENAIACYFTIRDATQRKNFRESVIKPIFNTLGPKINTANPNNKRPLLHQVLYVRPNTPNEFLAIEELLKCFYDYNADFNCVDAFGNTPAFALIHWVNSNSEKHVPQMIDKLFEYGCGFNRHNTISHTLLDEVQNANKLLLTCIRKKGGRTYAELSTEIQTANQKPYIKYIPVGTNHATLVTHINDFLSEFDNRSIEESFTAINTPGTDKNTCGHRLAARDHTLLQGIIKDDDSELTMRPKRRDRFGEFCDHGLKLDAKNSADKTVIDMFKDTEEFDYFLEDVRIRTAFQSQFSHEQIKSVLTRLQHKFSAMETSSNETSFPLVDMKQTALMVAFGKFPSAPKINDVMPPKPSHTAHIPAKK